MKKEHGVYLFISLITRADKMKHHVLNRVVAVLQIFVRTAIREAGQDAELWWSLGPVPMHNLFAPLRVSLWLLNASFCVNVQRILMFCMFSTRSVQRGYCVIQRLYKSACLIYKTI
jgi:hypothetical protein